MDDRTLLQQALDALEVKYSDYIYDGAGPAVAGAFEADVAALRARLAQPAPAVPSVPDGAEWEYYDMEGIGRVRRRKESAAVLAGQPEVLQQVINELDRATRKFPTWPTDPLHALAVLGEEFGELTKAMLQFTYEPKKKVSRQDIREEAIQTAAMALRLAMSLPLYDYAPGPQHKQDGIGTQGGEHG